MYNVIWSDLKLEWDERKNAINQKKHGISFQEAMSVSQMKTPCSWKTLTIRRQRSGSYC